MGFEELGLSTVVLQAVADAGYTTPTPIQAQAIPVVLTGRDVLGSAQTGTGKTAGFTLPMIDILASGRAKARMPRSIILEPTRELAAQVAENFDRYGKHTRLTKALIIGGSSMSDQERLLDRGVDVLIATPGRMIDLFERGKVLLADVKILVIDEADRMLDMGFIPDVEKIVGLLSPMRQTLFFSATMPPEIRRLADKFLQNPKEISVSPPATTAKTVDQHIVDVATHAKLACLKALIAREDVRNAIIFCNRKRAVADLERALVRAGFNAGCLHGDMPQSSRMETLSAFKRGDIIMLVASDVAARGLDVSGLSHVFNFDVPIHAEDYVHRIGRTGRAGRDGKAYTLSTPEDSKHLAAIERLIGRAIPRIVLDKAEEVEPAGADAAEALSGQEASQPRDGERQGRDDRDSRRRRGRDGNRDGGRRDEQPRVDTRRADNEAEARPGREKEREASERHRGERNGRREEGGRSQPRAPEPPRMDSRGGQRFERYNERPREHRRDFDDDPPVKGLGDHTPAFLLRPTPLPLSEDR